MVTYKMIKESKDSLITFYGETGKRIIEECGKAAQFNGDINDWDKAHCFGDTFDLNRFYLTGVQKAYPDVWNVIPPDAAEYNPFLSTDILILLGVDPSSM